MIGSNYVVTMSTGIAIVETPCRSSYPTLCWRAASCPSREYIDGDVALGARRVSWNPPYMRRYRLTLFGARVVMRYSIPKESGVLKHALTRLLVLAGVVALTAGPGWGPVTAQ